MKQNHPDVEFIYQLTKQHKKFMSPMTKSYIAWSLLYGRIKSVIKDGIGCALWEKRDNQMFLWKFAVTKECQGKGHAKQLMEELVELAQENNLDIICLYVKKNNARAINFYDKNGFEKTFTDKQSIHMIKYVNQGVVP